MNRLRKLIWPVALAAALITVAVAVLLRIGSPAVGAVPGGERLRRLENSPHYRDHRFLNTEPTSRIANGQYGAALLSYLRSDERREPGAPLPVDRPDLAAFAEAGPAKFIWLGHSTILASVDSTIILFDPVFKQQVPVLIGSTKRFLPAVLNLEELPPIDAVIISHDHYDHLEQRTVEFLAGRGTTFFVPLGVGAHLASWSVADSRIVELDWWESAPFQSLLLVCTPARHYSGRSLRHVDRTLWCSWVLLGPNARLYFGGDTGYTSQFTAIGARFGPFDLALLPIGAYGDYWPDVHMTPEEAVTAAVDLNVGLVFPLHWGTFDLAGHPWDDPIERLLRAATAAGVPLTTPRPGEMLSVDSQPPTDFWWREPDSD